MNILVRILKSWESPLLVGAIAAVIGFDYVPYAGKEFGLLDLDVLGLDRPHKTHAMLSEVCFVETQQ